MSTASPTIPVVSGDDRKKLHQQLSDIGCVNPETAFPFELYVRDPTIEGAPSVKIGVRITGMDAIDGSGVRWIIRGCIMRQSFESVPWLLWFLPIGGEFEGIYDTNRHMGHITSAA